VCQLRVAQVWPARGHADDQHRRHEQGHREDEYDASHSFSFPSLTQQNGAARARRYEIVALSFAARPPGDAFAPKRETHFRASPR
jgi:hypothetical protein